MKCVNYFFHKSLHTIIEYVLEEKKLALTKKDECAKVASQDNSGGNKYILFSKNQR